MMNEIVPFTRDALRHGLGEAVKAAKLYTEDDVPVFWAENHFYGDPDSSMKWADLWFFHNRKEMEVLLGVISRAWQGILLRPAVTETNASEARDRLKRAYASDEDGFRTLLQQQRPVYMDAVIQCLVDAAICDDEQAQLIASSNERTRPARLLATPESFHDAIQALMCTRGLLSKQPVPSNTSV